MWKQLSPVAAYFVLALLLAPPLDAQMWHFADYALPSSSGEPATWIAATYGRGINEISGQANSIGATIGKVSGRVAFKGALGYITDGDGEFTAGASVGVDLNSGDGPRVSAQAGLGWIDWDFFDETLTFWRIPVGIAVKGNMGSGDSSITPWVMPRLNVAVARGEGVSETETDFGVSGGVSVTMAKGLGFHTALDALFAGDDPILFLGLGFHYVLGRGN